MTKREQIAWAAGLFDGEGCISIARVLPSKRNDLKNVSYRLIVKVTMGHADTIRGIAGIFKVGSFQNHVSKSDRMNASFSWIASARHAEKVLRLMLPFLVTKLQEAFIALEFMQLPDVKRGGKKGSQEISAQLLERKHELYVQCAKLKSRYRFRKEPLE